MPLLFAALFFTVRLNLLVQQRQKQIAACETRADLLRREVAEKRHLLAGRIGFPQVEPVARAAGLRVVRPEQVMSLERVGIVSVPDRQWSGPGRRLLAGIVGLLGAPSAQAGPSTRAGAAWRVGRGAGPTWGRTAAAGAARGKGH